MFRTEINFTRLTYEVHLPSERCMQVRRSNRLSCQILPGKTSATKAVKLMIYELMQKCEKSLGHGQAALAGYVAVLD